MSERLNSHLTDKHLSVLTAILSDESKRLEDSFEDKKKELDAMTNNGKDEVDSANDQILMSSTMRFSKRENMFYKKILKAIKLMETEDYGLCDECGDSISFARLRARPTSEMCLNCKEESEREENQNFFKRKSKSLGEEFSFSSNPA
jgi:DnaK suppressor protein